MVAALISTTGPLPVTRAPYGEHNTTMLSITKSIFAKSMTGVSSDQTWRSVRMGSAVASLGCQTRSIDIHLPRAVGVGRITPANRSQSVGCEQAECYPPLGARRRRWASRSSGRWPSRGPVRTFPVLDVFAPVSCRPGNICHDAGSWRSSWFSRRGLKRWGSQWATSISANGVWSLNPCW